jgi:hypothetical protein
MLPDPNENLLVTRLEDALKRQLEPEERYEIEQWDRGRTLAQVTDAAWQVMFDTLKSYADNSTEDLVSMSPGNEKLKEQHAITYALNDLYVKFQQDVRSAISASTQIPRVMRMAASYVAEVPPESL